MKISISAPILFLTTLFFTPLQFAVAADDAAKAKDEFEYHTVTTRDGLVFRVPADMPIETRGGIQAPIPFDEYVYGKFKKMEKRVKELESRIEVLEKQAVPAKPAPPSKLESAKA